MPFTTWIWIKLDSRSVDILLVAFPSSPKLSSTRTSTDTRARSHTHTYTYFHMLTPTPNMNHNHRAMVIVGVTFRHPRKVPHTTSCISVSGGSCLMVNAAICITIEMHKWCVLLHHLSSFSFSLIPLTSSIWIVVFESILLSFLSYHLFSLFLLSLPLLSFFY